MTDALGASLGKALPVSFTSTINTIQPSSSNTSDINPPGSTNHGICSLSFQGKTFRFRTNPNEIWWTYELITHVDTTYGGQVIQLLGTKLGDLTVKVECGNGGWPYLMQVVNYLRDTISDQRNGNSAVFEYATRNWKLGVYAMNIPFQDQVQATGRELTLSFKIQEDVSSVISSATLSAELARLQGGVYSPTQNVHNKYNDFAAAGKTLDNVGTGGPTGYKPIGQANKVDSTPQGDNPGGVNPLAPFFASIPGFSALLGGK